MAPVRSQSVTRSCERSTTSRRTVSSTVSAVVARGSVPLLVALPPNPVFAARRSLHDPRPNDQRRGPGNGAASRQAPGFAARGQARCCRVRRADSPLVPRATTTSGLMDGSCAAGSAVEDLGHRVELRLHVPGWAVRGDYSGNTSGPLVTGASKEGHGEGGSGHAAAFWTD